MTLEEIKELQLPIIGDRTFVKGALENQAKTCDRHAEEADSWTAGKNVSWSADCRCAIDLIDFAVDEMAPAIDWLVAEVDRLREAT